MKKVFFSNINLILLLAIAAVTTYWALQFNSQEESSEPIVAVATSDRAPVTQPLDTGQLAGLFGASSTGTSRLAIDLVGVIAEGGENRGIALLSVSGRPATAFRVGEAVEGDMTLATVNTGSVLLQGSDGMVEVSLPERAPPSGIDPVK